MLEWRLEAYRRWLHHDASRPGRASTIRRSTTRTSTTTPRRKQKRRAEVARRGRSRSCSRPTRSSAFPCVSRRCWRAWARGRQQRSGRVAVDAVFDSVSVVTTFKDELTKAGVIFCRSRRRSASIPSWCGSISARSCRCRDNFFATLNSAVFSDGSFVYVPQGVRCPMELSTYFRINEKNTGQFERTLIIADKGSYVCYLEGCTAPLRDENQLHAAVVELIALDDAEIKYSTVQNWYPGDTNGKGGIYNFVTKRGDCRGRNSKISWTQVETGSAITWKYPSCILRGDNSRGEFYSIAISNGRQQVDTGTKMIHLGKQHLEPDHLQGDRRRPLQQHLSRPRLGPPQGRRRAQLHQLQLAPDRRQVRRPHGALYRGQERDGAVRARGDDLARFPTTRCSTACSAAFRRRRRWRSSSTASCATCCSSCRWSSRSRRRS